MRTLIRSAIATQTQQFHCSICRHRFNKSLSGSRSDITGAAPMLDREKRRRRLGAMLKTVERRAVKRILLRSLLKLNVSTNRLKRSYGEKIISGLYAKTTKTS